MNAKHIESGFAAMGARMKLNLIPSVTRGFRIDIQHDTTGDFFELRVPERPAGDMDVSVLQVQPKNRHLLLLVRRSTPRKRTDRYLCGRDEQEWFVAAVPGGASSVRQAMDALQPKTVRDALARNPVSDRKRYERKNRAFRRQGEWFFVPEPFLVVDEKFVLRNEPLRRGAGKPHMVEELFRTGGETVHVCARHPNGILEKEYRDLLRVNSRALRWGWRVMRRNPEVYARGTVRHSDHDTITLSIWHRVVMNTETQTRAMANVSFLD